MTAIMNTPTDLKTKFPYQFEGRNIGLSIPRGWFLGFAKLCGDIDQVLGANQHGFHGVQLKEKFGAACWYWSMNTRSGVHVNFLSADGVTSLVVAQSFSG